MRNNIPHNWIEARTGELFEIVGGGTPSTKTSEYWNGDTPWITSADISEDHRITLRKTVSTRGIAESATNKVPVGTLIVATRVGLGKSAVAEVPMCFSQDCQGLIAPGKRLDSGFLVYQIETITSEFIRQSQGTTIRGITKKTLADLKLRIAPTQEQQRIVEAIESYLTRLDAAVALLERVQKNLKHYRASVLKAAVEGRLVPTEAELAKKEGRTYEPAGELLERILVERRKKWIENAAEKARAKAKEKARKAGKPWIHADDIKTLERERIKAAKKCKEPAVPDTSNLPNLPEGWCRTTLDTICEIQGGLTKGKRRNPTDIVREVPYLRVANVQRGWLDLAKMKSIGATEEEIRRLTLQEGDVLFNEGGDRDKLGRGWVWEGQIRECIHQNHVFRARIIGAAILPRLLSWYGNTKGQEYFFGQGKQVVNLASLSQTRLKALPIPLPPIPEQYRIEEEIDKLLSSVEAIATETASSVKRCNRLRQSILKWAFEGKLVEQDPTDEPASALLERIRAERSAERSGTRR